MLDLTMYRKNKDKLVSYLDLIEEIEKLAIRYLTWPVYNCRTVGDGLDGAMNFEKDVIDRIDILANQSSRTINGDKKEEKVTDLIATYDDHNIWCSECMTEWTVDDYKWNFLKTFQYCPHCGAKVEHVVVLPEFYTPKRTKDEDEYDDDLDNEWCNEYCDYWEDCNNCSRYKKEEEIND